MLLASTLVTRLAFCVHVAVLVRLPVFTDELPYVLVCVHVYFKVLVTVADVRAVPMVVPRAVAVNAPVDEFTAVNPFVVVLAME